MSDINSGWAPQPQEAFHTPGQGLGPIANVLNDVRQEPGMMRPFLSSQNVPCVSIPSGRVDNEGNKEMKTHRISDLQARGIHSPVFNATSLRKEQWIQFDQAVIKAARERLRAWSDLRSANTFGGFNAMARTTLEYEAMSDPGEAVQDMDGLSEGRTDNPLFSLRSMPLPITHSDFWFSSRRLEVSRSGPGALPLDTTMAEAAGRRVAEMIEKQTIGTIAGMNYGYQSAGVTAHDSTYLSKVYGYINFPSTLTSVSLTAPDGTNPDTTVGEVLEMRQALYDNKFYGPYVLYHSDGWDRYLDNDYFAGTFAQGLVSGSKTLRQRLEAIEGISAVRRLDFLTTDYKMIMVQMTSDVARAVNGMDIQTVQWESQGGMRLNFKVMAIQVPQLRADYNDRTGILYATS